MPTGRSLRRRLSLTAAVGFVLVSFLLAGAALSGRPVVAAEPAAPVYHWRLGSEESTRLVPHGNVGRDVAGPRPPEFPDFTADNTAVQLDGRGARLMFADPGPHSDLDFTNGDEITVQAWVKLDRSIGNNNNVYVVGKGRTGDKRFAADNQNWALRLRGVGGQARISFLFASERKADQPRRDSHWHRWTSSEGFVAGTGWHRIAVRYRFGQPDSIAAWLNEKPLGGSWDMGGATTEPPVLDDDALWIGSSMGGSPANSFSGWLDEIAIYRSALNDQQLASLYRRQGDARSVTELPDIAPAYFGTDRDVTVRVLEAIGAHDRWLPLDSQKHQPVVRYQTDQMLFPRLPQRYDAYGVRSSWRPTSLLQAATRVRLPAGKHQLLLRARGASRLWLDDQLVAKLGVRSRGGGAHWPVDPLPAPPLPGHRLLPYGDQEAIAELVIEQAGEFDLIAESLVGSPRLRAEPGEMLVAIRLQDSDTFTLVPGYRPPPALRTSTTSTSATTAAPTTLNATTLNATTTADAATAAATAIQSAPVVYPLTDVAMETALAAAEAQLSALDIQRRREAAAAHDDYWRQRHAIAADWVQHNPGPTVPELPAGHSGNAVDAFLLAKIEAARQQSDAESVGDVQWFQAEVAPILQQHCVRCHGEDGEGGLRLTSREALLAGGDSGLAAVVPQQADDSLLWHRVAGDDEGERMPPGGGLTEAQLATLKRWIDDGVAWGRNLPAESLQLAATIDDASFIRRAYLDCWGVPPTEQELRDFLADDRDDKRSRLIDRLLDDAHLADHWVSYWQDVLAENPSMLKPSINNTGPFRYYLHDALVDRWPLDRLVTELVMLRGSEREGGAAGFGMAADNDAPLATRGIVLASAFLGVDLQCARCHDSPYHDTTQQDLFSLAAMIHRKPLSVPPTSTVAPGFFEANPDRRSLIRVTLLPGVPVQPQWPFAGVTELDDGAMIDRLVRSPEDSRERLAALITAPGNQRFAAVLVNRLWSRLMGAGIVQPVDDWQGTTASHPQLLTYLARQLVASGYDLRHVLRLILTSDAYGRAAVGSNRQAAPSERFFAAPDRRRMTAEQVVDSLVVASGHRLDVDELTFDADGWHAAGTMVSLGKPRRSWQFAELSNERDRPSLALPRAQAVADVLAAFGWEGARQNGISQRDVSPNVLQPGILANGVMSSWIVRASLDSELAQLALDAASPDQLLESLFLRFAGRLPHPAEQLAYGEVLQEGFDQRLTAAEDVRWPEPPEPLRHVSWRNHLAAEANVIKIEMEKRAREGTPPDPRLQPQWRQAYEDVVWALVNSPESVWVP